MTVSRLLKSWATPPASWPTASIFCACRSWASRRLLVGHVPEDAEHADHPAGFVAHRRLHHPDRARLVADMHFLLRLYPLPFGQHAAVVGLVLLRQR